jgi:hypothetical protein
MAATAVQLRQDHDLQCSIIYGSPFSYSPGKYGKIALFNESQLIIYCISKGRKQKAFVFRSCRNGSDRIPGVYPAVTLLAEAQTKGKVTRLMRIIAALSRRDFDISGLDDGFFVRINAILGNRKFRIADAINCLSHAKSQTI